VKPRDLLIEVLGQHVHLVLVRVALGEELYLSEEYIWQWEAVLDVVGTTPKEVTSGVICSEPPIMFRLKARPGRYHGVVSLELKEGLSTLTAGGFGARQPIVAAVSGATIRRVDA
jgi:hypothetical protein